VLWRLPVALVAGLVLSLAFEPVALPWLLPVPLAAFALVTRGLPATRAWLPGLVFGAAFYFTHIWWMRASIGAAGWITLSSVETLFYAALGSVSTLLQRLRVWPLWLAGAWAAMEVLRSSYPLSGMPWGRLSFAVVDTPAAPALAYVGLTGLSALLALTGFTLASVLVAHGFAARARAGLGLMAVVAVTCVPALVPFRLPTTGQTTVAAVQGDVPGPGNNILYDPLGVTSNHVDATVGLADDVAAGQVPQPDLVIWPENSTAVDPFQTPVVEAGIERAVAAIGVPVLVGALVDDGPDRLLNQGIVWDPETGPGERYGKQNPVPYGEYIPWRDHMPSWFLTAGRLGEIGRDMQAGDRTTPLDIAGVRVADAICFDVVYEGGIAAQVENGADLLAVQTSNASFIFTDQIDQQFATTRLRAVETGKYAVVAAANGISGIIAPDGTVLARTSRLTQDVLVETVGLRSGVTPGVRVGPWLSVFMPASTVIGLALVLVAHRRRRRDTPSCAVPVTVDEKV